MTAKSRYPSRVNVLVRRLARSMRVALPGYQSQGAAGMDLAAAVKNPVCIPPGRVKMIPSGLAIALPVGFEAQIRPRSGIAVKHKVFIPNTPATIDSDYRGEIIVPLINFGAKPFVVTRGMRIAQMVVAPVSRVEWQLKKKLPPTARGTRGFGHTGN